YGSPLGVRVIPSPAIAEQAEGRALYALGASKAGKNPLFSRSPRAPQALHRLVRRRPRRPRDGDDRLYASVVPLCLQGDSRLVRAAEGHRARKGERAISAREVSRPSRANGRY